MRQSEALARGRRPRRGMGVLLVLILALLLVMALIGVARRFLGSQVTDMTARAAAGRHALSLAGSAVDEAFFQISRRLNDPSDPLFDLLRKEVYAGETGQEVLTVEVPRTRELASEEPYENYVLDGPEVTVLYQNQFSTLPYEKFGVITCRASAYRRRGLTGKVGRQVEVARGFKVALISTPRPYDQTTLYIQDGTSLGTEAANERMREALSAMDAYRASRDGILDRLDQERGDLERAGIDVDDLRERYSSLSFPDLRPLLHEFEEEYLTLFRTDPEVDLRSLDIPGTLRTHDAAAPAVERDFQRTRDQLALEFTSLRRHQNHIESLQAAMTVRENLLRWLLAFQESFAEYAGDASIRLAAFDYKLELVEWRRKAFHVLSEKRGSVGRQLRELKERLGTLNGVILVDNPSGTLALDGELSRLPGLLVLVTTGGLVLENTNRSVDPPSLLTVVSYGPMRASGEVHASLLPRGGLTLGGGTRVVGNLILPGVPDPSALTGVVTADPRYRSGRTTPTDTSGAFSDYYYAALSPRITWRMVSPP